MQRRLERNPHFKLDLDRAFRDVFLAVDDSLRQEPIIEPYYAGTTAVVALLREGQLTLANVGDSRAVLAQRRHLPGHSNEVAAAAAAASWTALDLTQDQNPDSPDEQARIERILSGVAKKPEPPKQTLSKADQDAILSFYQ